MLKNLKGNLFFSEQSLIKPTIFKLAGKGRLIKAIGKDLNFILGLYFEVDRSNGFFLIIIRGRYVFVLF